MKTEDVISGIKKIRPKMPRNRLRRHLEDCALHYGCPAAKNFFLGRYEAPLPTSPRCNARCLGCLSLQTSHAVPVSQERIAFTPSDDEIAEVALEHIRRVPRGIVSFGQGCEGDPLLAAAVIEPAIRKIRAATLRGTIHMNTNGSSPDILATLFEAGLDSLRISLNSVREICYTAYFQPKGYGFTDVVKSIQLGIRRKKFVALNYLNCPGFTDTPEEANALVRFLRQHRVNLIQWRNLNLDPVGYLKEMDRAAVHGRPLGIPKLLGRIRKTFPNLKHGYYNPPKEKFS
ncbi:MAG: radical SAM protein [Desulfobacterales bacterium]